MSISNQIKSNQIKSLHANWGYHYRYFPTPRIFQSHMKVPTNPVHNSDAYQSRIGTVHVLLNKFVDDIVVPLIPLHKTLEFQGRWICS